MAANAAADFHFHVAGCGQNLLDGFVVVLGPARQGSIQIDNVQTRRARGGKPARQFPGRVGIDLRAFRAALFQPYGFSVKKVDGGEYLHGAF
jgi:hypothetical protein